MSRSRSPTTGSRTAAAALLALAAASVLTALAAASAGAAPWPWRSVHAAGDRVRVQGTVADPAGQPLAGLTVELEAWNPSFDWSSWSTETGPVERRSTRSSERGEFGLDWTWDPGHRRFDLVARLREEVAGRTLDLELARVDVTERMTGSPSVAAALVVERADLVRRARAFLAALASDDERRAWRDLGLPERVERVESPLGDEAAWWYFAAGRVARFRDGRLVEIETFAPVRPVGGEAEP